jgi:H+/Cl- antiporter ClcA
MPAKSPQPNVTAEPSGPEFSGRFWLTAVVGGVLAGLAGGLLMRLLRAVQHIAFSYSSGDFLSAVARVAPHRRVESLLVAGLLVALVRVLMKLTNQRPRGLTGAIWKHDGELPFLSTAMDALMSISVVGMGVSLGREAALKDAGAVLASKLSDALRLSPRERKILVACAAGAGMGAAYNVPFGGGLFAAEVLLGSMSLPIVLPALTMSLIATAASWLLLPNAPTYDVPMYAMHSLDLLWAVLAMPVFAVFSVAWVRAVAWSASLKPSGWWRYLSPVAVFGCLGLLAGLVPDLLGNGKGVVQRAFVDGIDVKLASLLLALKFLSTTACNATGTPGGLFTPTMTLGALLGELLGRGWSMLLPGSAGGRPPGLYAVIGASAVLSAATLGPISSIVMMIELTHGADSLLIPMMLASAGAVLIAKKLQPVSIYSARSEH